MPDGIVKLCVPAHWSGTSIGDITVGLSQVSVTDIYIYGDCCNMPAGLVRLLQTKLLVRNLGLIQTCVVVLFRIIKHA